MKLILGCFETVVVLLVILIGLSNVCWMITEANTLLNIAGLLIAAVGAACIVQYTNWRVKWYVR